MKKSIFLVILLLIVTLSSFGNGENTKSKKIKPALLVVDIQNQFLPMMQQEGQKQTLYMINEYMQYFRQQKLPVFLIYHTTPGYGPKPGTAQFEFPKTIKIAPSDIKVTKNFGNAFKKTKLNKLLKDKGINTLFITGLSGPGCIIATYHGAYDLDYKVFLIKGTILSPKAKYTDWVEELCDSVGYSALSLILQAAK